MRFSLVVLVAFCCAFAGGCGPVEDTVAVPEPLVIAIEGMTCEGCVNFITQDFAVRPGVEEVAVSLENKEARLVVNPKTFNLAKAALDLQKKGYTLTKK